jgi:hypothetical protein
MLGAADRRRRRLDIRAMMSPGGYSGGRSCRPADATQSRQLEPHEQGVPHERRVALLDMIRSRCTSAGPLG